MRVTSGVNGAPFRRDNEAEMERRSRSESPKEGGIKQLSTGKACERPWGRREIGALEMLKDASAAGKQRGRRE